MHSVPLRCFIVNTTCSGAKCTYEVFPAQRRHSDIILPSKWTAFGKKSFSQNMYLEACTSMKISMLSGEKWGYETRDLEMHLFICGIFLACSKGADPAQASSATLCRWHESRVYQIYLLRFQSYSKSHNNQTELFFILGGILLNPNMMFKHEAARTRGSTNTWYIRCKRASLCVQCPTCACRVVKKINHQIQKYCVNNIDVGGWEITVWFNWPIDRTNLLFPMALLGIDQL